MEKGNDETAVLSSELDLLAEMLFRERSMLAGSRTADQAQMRAMTEKLLDDDSMAV